MTLKLNMDFLAKAALQIFSTQRKQHHAPKMGLCFAVFDVKLFFRAKQKDDNEKGN